MVRMVALLRSPECRARIHAAARAQAGRGNRASVTDLENWEEVRGGAAAGRIDAVVFDPSHPTLPPGASLARQIEGHGRITFVLYGGPVRPVQYLVDLARAGVRWAITPGLDDEPKRLALLMRHVFRAATEERLLREAAPDMSTRQLGLVRMFLRHTHDCGTMEQLSERVGMSTRTLERRTRELGLPRPAQLLGIGHLYTGATLMAYDGASVEAAARASGFSSAAAFRRALRRTTGFSPRQVREIAQDGRLTSTFARLIRPQTPQLTLTLSDSNWPLRAM